MPAIYALPLILIGGPSPFLCCTASWAINPARKSDNFRPEEVARHALAGLLRHVARTDGARTELLRHLAADVGEGLLHRRHRRAEHGLAILARPAVGADDGVE